MDGLFWYVWIGDGIDSAPSSPNTVLTTWLVSHWGGEDGECGDDNNEIDFGSVFDASDNPSIEDNDAEDIFLGDGRVDDDEEVDADLFNDGTVSDECDESNCISNSSYGLVAKTGEIYNMALK